MNRPLHKFFLLALAGAAIFPQVSHADAPSLATPSSWIVTLRKIELCEDRACTKAIILGSGDRTFDIASVTSGAAVGDYAANASIPRGITYPYLRITMSRTFQIKGAASVNAGIGANAAQAACYTQNTGNTSGEGAIIEASPVQATNLTNARAAAALQDIYLVETEFVPGGTMVAESYTVADDIQTHQLPTAVYIRPDDPAPQIELSLDVSNGLSMSPTNGNTECEVDSEPPTISFNVH